MIKTLMLNKARDKHYTSGSQLVFNKDTDWTLDIEWQPNIA